MPWETIGGDRGPWGHGPRRGTGGGGGGQEPPNLDDILRKGGDRMRRMLPRGLGGKGLPLLLLAALVLWLLTGIYRVDEGERGVIMLLGKYQETSSAGLHYRLPSPFTALYRVLADTERQEEIGFISTNGGRRDIREESLMLTGDENIVDIDFSVIWNVKEPRAYIFNLAQPEITVKAMAESAMREVVGRNNFVTITTEGRQIIERDVQALLQSTLDDYEAGVSIKRLQLLKSDPPDTVIDAFRDVQRARSDLERRTAEAQAFSNRILPEARGQAVKIQQQALAYKEKVIADATGQASRFKAVLTEYRKAKDVTRKRMYLETMEDILRGMNKVILDKGAAGSGVLPYMPLPALDKGAK